MRARHITRDSARNTRQPWELERVRGGGGGPRRPDDRGAGRDLRGAQGLAFALLLSAAIWAAVAEAAWRWLY